MGHSLVGEGSSRRNKGDGEGAASLITGFVWLYDGDGETHFPDVLDD